MVHLLGFLQQMCGNRTQDSLHHSKVFFTVMGLEGINTIGKKKQIKTCPAVCRVMVESMALNSVTYLEEGGSEVVLNEDTTHTPHVA